MGDSTKWWQDLPCHYHPSWNLGEVSQLDLNKLKHHIDRNENNLMVVERMLFAAFLGAPIGKLYNMSKPSVVTTRKYLQDAEQYVNDKFKDNRDASIGYGIVIYACRMWTGQRNREWEKILLEFEEQKKEYPKHKQYISAVRAFALSRLGPKWAEEAKWHYEDALEGFPDNVEWLYGKSSMIGRLARHKYPKVNSSENLPKIYRELLEEERNTLEVVLKLNKDFHIARAMYGQCLSYLGQQEEAKWHIEKANIDAPENRSIAEIKSKYCKRMGDVEEAINVLDSLPQESKTAEVHFLLGNLYKGKTYNETQYSNKMKLWKKALAYFEKAVKLDERHYPALNSRAEMNAKLGKIREAKEQYTDLLSGNLLDKPYHQRDKFMALKTLLHFPPNIRNKLLNDEELVNYSYELLKIALTDYSEESRDGIFNDFASKPAEKSMRELQNMSRGRDISPSISPLAKLRLAQFNLMRKDYRTAEVLYFDLKGKSNDLNSDVTWGLAKCYLGKRQYKEAKEKADELSKQKQTYYRVEELYADISLSLAKVELQEPNPRIFCEHVDAASDDTFDMAGKHGPGRVNSKVSITNLLEQAIEMGSLEACFIFLFSLVPMQTLFLSKSQEIPRIIAKIEQVRSDKIINVHTDFQVSDFETEFFNRPTDDKEILERKIEEILKYPEIIKNHGFLPVNVLNVYHKLAQLRKHLFDFELAVVRQMNTDWDKTCEVEVGKVLCQARFLLDHVISVYQDCLIKGKRLTSNICVCFDWKEGKIDQEEASKEIQKWLNRNFPQRDLPDVVTKTLLQMQPMYDKRNIWLVALNTFVNDVKHAGGRPLRHIQDSSSTEENASSSGNELYQFDLLKGAKKAFLARQSCQKVEDIVLTILNEIVKLHQSSEEQPHAFAGDLN